MLPWADFFLKTPQLAAPIQIEISQEERVRLIGYDSQCVLGDMRAEFHAVDSQLNLQNEKALKTLGWRDALSCLATFCIIEATIRHA